MELLIHTYGRHDRQETWKNLGPELHKCTKLVVQEREAHRYEDYPLVVLPPHLTKLAPTRQWLMTEYEAEGDNLIILDDDLRFAVRREDDPTKFKHADHEDVTNLFYTLEDILGEKYPLCGIAAREGGNRNTEAVNRACRQMRVHGIHLPTYQKLGIRFDRVDVMEDFDVTLQFLRAGHMNLVANLWVTDQGGSNSEGGCSHYRTPEVQDASARRLAELHPGFVTVVKKTTKAAWGGGERTDVRVQWKKAYQSATAPVPRGL